MWKSHFLQVSPMHENYRRTDGLWRYPNGDWHPRNFTHIYDADGRLREKSSQREGYKGASGLRHFLTGRRHPGNIYVTDGPADPSSPGSSSPVERATVA